MGELQISNIATLLESIFRELPVMDRGDGTIGSFHDCGD